MFVITEFDCSNGMIIFSMKEGCILIVYVYLKSFFDTSNLQVFLLSSRKNFATVKVYWTHFQTSKLELTKKLANPKQLIEKYSGTQL